MRRISTHAFDWGSHSNPRWRWKMSRFHLEQFQRDIVPILCTHHPGPVEYCTLNETSWDKQTLSCSLGEGWVFGQTTGRPRKCSAGHETAPKYMSTVPHMVGSIPAKSLVAPAVRSHNSSSPIEKKYRLHNGENPAVVSRSSHTQSIVSFVLH